MDKDAEELLQERLSPLLGSLTYANQTSWLAFTNVEMHDDDWSQVYVGSKRYAPEFLHIVLSGRATIVDHSGSYEVALGDVFSFNPNAKHGVSSNSLCVTASFVVPRIQLNRTANTGL